MRSRSSRAVVSLLAVSLVAMTSAYCLAVYHDLGPSKDDWKMKYDLKVNGSDGDMVDVSFVLADEGRLKPIYSATVVAFSAPDRDGGRSYDVKAPIELKKAASGRGGKVQIRKEFADRAMIRILTLNVDGKRQTAGAAYYDIPLKKFLREGAAVP